MIIINGASRGIGLFLFDKYLQSGIDVVGTYNSTNPMITLTSFIK